MRRLGAIALVALLAGIAASLASGQESSCVTVDGPGGVYVNLANDTNSGAIAHVRAAVERGQPRELHWRPDLATQHRAQSLKGIPTREGFDRDEYPPAATLEGGTGADVAYVASADNRSAGSRMSRQMSAFCDGQKFILEP